MSDRMWLTSHMSKIVNTAAANIIAIFDGQTVSHSDVCAQIETEYAAARKRTAYGSYVQVFNNLLAAGVTCKWTGPNYTGDHLYIFPATN